MYKKGFIILAVALLGSLCAMAQGLTNVWSRHIGTGGESSPALSPDGTLYFGSWDYHLYAVTTNGYVKWAFLAGLDIKSSPAIADDGTVYFGCRDRKFYAVTPEGKLKWTFPTEGWVDSSPAIAPDGTVYFGSWDKSFYALNPTGAKKWAFSTGGPIVSSPAIGTDGTIYFGSHDKNLYALRPDGTKKWEFSAGGPITSSPAIDSSGKIYFSSVDGKFYALKPDGTLDWSTRTGGITESSPVIAGDGTIYVCINQFRSAISPAGKVKWRQPNDANFMDSTPALAEDGRTFYAGSEGTLTGLEPNSDIPSFIWLKVGTAVSPLIAPNGLIYILGAVGKLEAVDDGGTALAQSAWPMFRANLRHTGVVNSAAQ